MAFGQITLNVIVSDTKYVIHGINLSRINIQLFRA